MTTHTYIISLGGSLIAPSPTGTVNTDYLTHFKHTLLPFIEEGHKFVLITGGGKIARVYQEALSTTTETTNESLDWIGIYATHLNARLVQMIFGSHAYETIITSPDQAHLAKTDTSVIVGGGWTPGNSTDFVATSLAEQSGASYVLNLSNITYAYTKDPDTHADAEPIYDMRWSEFQALFDTQWTPGASVPFDPAATNKAAEHGLEVHIMNGNHLDNLQTFLRTGNADGTRLHA